MAISSHSDAEASLLDDTIEGVVDYRGRPVQRSKSGGWRSAAFIIGVEFFERFSFYGVRSNLINFLTGPLGISTATAAANVNAWSGTASLLTLLGAFVADSFLGRYLTIVAASLLYVLGLGLLTLAALLQNFQFQQVLFFFSLYLVAIALGGHKPCLQAFGAGQFDGQDLEESKAKSSFFNWWYFGICSGTLVTYLTVCYIQENISWALGFGVPFTAIVVALMVFLLGATTYRYTDIKQDERSPFVRIGRVFVIAFRNWRTTPSAIATEGESRGFKFLNKALNIVPVGLKEEDKNRLMKELT